MIRTSPGAATMAACIALMAPGASASLIGDEVSVGTTLGLLTFSPATATVAEGPVEFVGAFNVYPRTMLIDVEANSINFLGLTGVVFAAGHSVTVSDLDFSAAAGGITGVSVTGVDPSRVSHTAHSVTLDIGRLSLSSINATVTFDTTVRAAIPEPGSLVVLGAGLLGLLGVRHGRRERARPDAAGTGSPSPA